MSNINNSSQPPIEDCGFKPPYGSTENTWHFYPNYNPNCTCNTCYYRNISNSIDSGDVTKSQSLIGRATPKQLNQLLFIGIWAIRNRLQIVKLLLDNGADPNTYGPNYRHDYKTILDDALSSFNIELITLLLDYGASPNKSEHGCSSHLNTACTVKNKSRTFRNVTNSELVDLLLSRGANIHDTKLQNAILSNNKYLITELIKSKLSLLKETENNSSSSASTSATATLSNFNSALDIQFNDRHNTFCGFPIVRPTKNFIIKELSQCLIEAVRCGNETVCEILLENGADPNYIHFNEENALRLACKYRNRTNIVKLLLLYGANISNVEFPCTLPQEIINFPTIMLLYMCSEVDKKIMDIESIQEITNTILDQLNTPRPNQPVLINGVFYQGYIPYFIDERPQEIERCTNHPTCYIDEVTPEEEIASEVATNAYNFEALIDL